MPLIAALLVAPAHAVDTSLPAETDHVFWCASAFYWLSADADDSGDADEAALYDTWSDRLLTRGNSSLDKLGYSADRKDALIEEYDVAVLAELGTPRARFNIDECPKLVSQ